METGLLYRQSPGCPVQPPGCTCLQSGWSPLHNDQNWDWDTSLMSMTLSMSVSMVGTRPACTPSVVRVWIVPAAARAICMGWEMMRSTCRVLDRMVAEMVMSPISHQKGQIFLTKTFTSSSFHSWEKKSVPWCWRQPLQSFWSAGHSASIQNVTHLYLPPPPAPYGIIVTDQRSLYQSQVILPRPHIKKL